MCNTKESASMHTLWAYSTSIIHATLATTISFTKRCTAFGTLVAILDDASLATSMSFAEHDAPLCSL
jgi:hypothetical protein